MSTALDCREALARLQGASRSLPSSLPPSSTSFSQSLALLEQFPLEEYLYLLDLSTLSASSDFNTSLFGRVIKVIEEILSSKEASSSTVLVEDFSALHEWINQVTGILANHCIENRPDEPNFEHSTSPRDPQSSTSSSLSVPSASPNSHAHFTGPSSTEQSMEIDEGYSQAEGGAVGEDVNMDSQEVTTEKSVSSAGVAVRGGRKRGRQAARSDEEYEEEEEDGRESTKKKVALGKGNGRGKGKGKQVAEENQDWEEDEEQEERGKGKGNQVAEEDQDWEEGEDDEDEDEFDGSESPQASSSHGARAARAARRSSKKKEEDSKDTRKEPTWGQDNSSLVTMARASEEVFDLLVATVRRYHLACQDHRPPHDLSQRLYNKHPFVELYQDWHIPTGRGWEKMVSAAVEKGFTVPFVWAQIDRVSRYLRSDSLDIAKIKDRARKTSSEVRREGNEGYRQAVEVQIPHYLELSKKPQPLWIKKVAEIVQDFLTHGRIRVTAKLVYSETRLYLSTPTREDSYVPHVNFTFNFTDERFTSAADKGNLLAIADHLKSLIKPRPLRQSKKKKSKRPAITCFVKRVDGDVRLECFLDQNVSISLSPLEIPVQKRFHPLFDGLQQHFAKFGKLGHWYLVKSQQGWTLLRSDQASPTNKSCIFLCRVEESEDKSEEEDYEDDGEDGEE